MPKSISTGWPVRRVLTSLKWSFQSRRLTDLVENVVLKARPRSTIPPKARSTIKLVDRFLGTVYPRPINHKTTINHLYIYSLQHTFSLSHHVSQRLCSVWVQPSKCFRTVITTWILSTTSSYGPLRHTCPYMGMIFGIRAGPRVMSPHVKEWFSENKTTLNHKTTICESVLFLSFWPYFLQPTGLDGRTPEPIRPGTVDAGTSMNGTRRHIVS